MTSRNLGRGLSALLGQQDEYEEQPQNVKMVMLSDLEPSPFQPRRVFDEEAINDLVESIRTKGVLQPLIVRVKNGDKNKYEIVGGERRWRASQLAGLMQVPVLIKQFTDKEALEVALIENLQRQDLNALEEAEGYQRLMEEFSNTQEELAKAVGKSRSHVANTMRLLALPEKVKKYLETGKLTSGHARALLTAKEPEVLADAVIAKGLNVRQTEKLAQEGIEKKKRHTVTKKSEKQEESDSLAADLSKILGMNVSIKSKSNGGELTICYETLEQLDKLIRCLSVSKNGADNQFSDTSEPENADVLQMENNEEEDVVFDDSFSQALNEDVLSLDNLPEDE